MSKVYWSLEECNLLMDAAVKLVRGNEKDCDFVLTLLEKAQRAALTPDRQRDVNTIDRKVTDSFWERAHDRAARERRLEFLHSEEVAELKKQLEKPLKIHALLESLIQELGVTQSDSLNEWKAQINTRFQVIEIGLKFLSETVSQINKKTFSEAS